MPAAGLEQLRFTLPINLDAKPTTGVGWIKNDKNMDICNSGYAEGHTSPQCILKLWQLDKVVTNYEALSDKYRADVRDNAYNDAKAYLDLNKKAVEKAAEERNDTQKN